MTMIRQRLHFELINECECEKEHVSVIYEAAGFVVRRLVMCYICSYGGTR